MSFLSERAVAAVINAVRRADSLLDFNIHNNIDVRHEFLQQIIFADNSLTNVEKILAISAIISCADEYRIIYNEGEGRICEKCQEKCLARKHCENCIRNYLKAKFSSWTSGNTDIDNLIQECQMKSLSPRLIIEWIPYDNLKVAFPKFILQT